VARARSSSRRTPVWAVLCTVLGAVLVLASGGLVATSEWIFARYDLAQRDLFGDQTDRYGKDVHGPLNILLAGLDARPGDPEEPPRADSIMIVHIDENLEHGYLISLPRDLLVDIPPLPEAGYPGGVDRLNAAMHFGSQQTAGEELPDLERGFAHLARTVGNLTGVAYWDAGLVVDFEGFVGVVDALGGVTMELEERIVSEHRKPDGSHRPLNPDGDGYYGPQAVYEAGQHHLEGWQALDIARQRYGFEDGDFTRQRHQQQLLKAIADRALSRDVVTDPAALDRVIRAAGDSVVFDGRGNRAVDFAFALRDLRPETLTAARLPTVALDGGGSYQGEQLDPSAEGLFAALRADRLGEYFAENPDMKD
jgi:polyisoprenyl-teichoic acid--peptidoglycan teichoic acid transferase